MMYECDEENMILVKDKIMDRIDFYEIFIGFDFFEEFFNDCLYVWI